MTKVGAIRWSCLLALVMCVGLATPNARSGPMGDSKLQARSPREELATFKLIPGFRAELVASEPDVVDPVSMCFDEQGRMYVCEMIGYPNGGVGTGDESRGRIRRLEDKDGDGIFETSIIFAQGLRFPMGITPWKNGVIVAVAPDIRFLADTTGDGKADQTTILYTGFNLANIQQMVNSLQWAYDGWVYGVAGNNAGTIQSAEKPDAPPLTLQSRGFRFRPEVPASLEPTSGGGQYGITTDNFGHWFTNTNSQHLRQIVFPDHYLQRNPTATVPATTIDIPEHGAASKVFRISPFEAWRVERTTRRAGSPDAKRFASTELVPGGFITSGCSPLVYTAEVFPQAFQGNVFICDPANNLIHRDVLEANGSVFRAKRGEADCEFLASTDNFFRPVHLSIGPDGAMYVLDFYREAIETPLSLPEDIKSKMNLESQGRGRIWRIVPEGIDRPAFVKLSPGNTEELVAGLTHGNTWVRQTAQRLIIQDPPAGIAQAIQQRIPEVRGTGRISILLGTLARLGALRDQDLIAALQDPVPGNREVALRFCERRNAYPEALLAAIQPLASDAVPMVRFQAALTATYLPDAAREAILADTLATPGGDSWIQSAVLCSAGQSLVPLLQSILSAPSPEKEDPSRRLAIVSQASSAVGTRNQESEVLALLGLLSPEANAIDLALIEGLGQGMQGKGRSLGAWLAKPPAKAKASVATIQRRFQDAAGWVQDESRPLEVRLVAARALAFAPYETAAPALLQVLTPLAPSELQVTAIRALARHADKDVGAKLIAAWPSAAPPVRRELIEQLLARPERISALMDAIEKKSIRITELDPGRIQQLRTTSNAAIKARAEKLLAGAINPDRKGIIDRYLKADFAMGNPMLGAQVFKAQCASCHKLGQEGHEVGPNLLAVLGGKSTEDLMIAILDPNREIDQRYLNYQISTLDGRTLTGIIAAEAPNAITLRRADGTEDVIRRNDIETLRSTGLSLMPEGIEQTVKPDDIVHLLAFLRAEVARQK